MTKEEEYQRRKVFGKLSRRQELSERSKYHMFTFKKKDFTFKGFYIIEEPSFRWGPTSDELKPLTKKLDNNEYLTFRWNAEILRLIRKDGIGRKQFFFVFGKTNVIRGYALCGNKNIKSIFIQEQNLINNIKN